MILITGATGTVGSEVVSQLSGAGVPVRALVRNVERAAKIRLREVEIVPGDLDRPETLEAALKGVERAFLLSSTDLRQVELQGNFIRAAQRAGNPHIVKLSVMGADIDSPAAILRMHRQTEIQLEDSGLEFTHLRPGFFMQNLINYMGPTIKTKGAIYQPMKDAKLAFIDVRDIAAVAVAALTKSGHKNKAYTLTGSEALSYHEVAEKLSQVLGQKINYVDISPEEYKKSLMGAGVPQWYAEEMVKLCDQAVKGSISVITRTVPEVIGRPPISFDQFVRDYADELRPAEPKAA